MVSGRKPSLFISPRQSSHMAVRTVRIDRIRCNGCGLCVKACHEGAMALVDGKAELVRPNLCDGLGDCLPVCPQGAITFVEKDVVMTPGLMADPGYQWPIQMGLVSQMMGRLEGTLVIAADCTAFTYDGDFKKRFIDGKAVVIGCPKLDDRARFAKIDAILEDRDIDRIEIVRMEVPCCSMLTRLVKDSVERSGKDIEVSETVISRKGEVITL